MHKGARQSDTLLLATGEFEAAMMRAR